jgi:hypothetical protein
MAHSKCNLGKSGVSLAYSISAEGVLVWRGECNVLADDLLSAPATADERSALEEAEDFLREKLSDGPLPANEIYVEAERSGISKATLRRATKKLGIKRRPDGFKGTWMHTLPTPAHETSELLIPSP